MEPKGATAYLESLVAKVGADLISIHGGRRQRGLLFPRRRDGSLRISEQESKYLFLHNVSNDGQFSYSVETPTGQTYRQKGVSDMSARIDLTLVGDAGQTVNVELKAHNCGEENIRKDLEKLVRENTMGIWFHTLEKGGPVRVGSLLETFRRAFGQIVAHLETSEMSYLIAICSLQDRALYWTWLNFTGSLNLNLAAIEGIFCNGGLTSPQWKTISFEIDCPSGSDGDANPAPTGPRYKGKGSRQGYFIYAPSITSESYMHLSGRGESYKIRNFYRSRAARASGFVHANYPTLDLLRRSGVVSKWLSVSADDSRHNLIEEPGYWYERIRQINCDHLQE